MALDSTPSHNPLPPRTRLLLNLSTQSQLLDQFFTTLSNPTSANATNLPNLYQLLQETTNDLLALRKDVQAHQEVWTRIEGKKREVVDLEKRSRGLMRALKVESEELGVMVKEGREIIHSVDKLEKGESHPYTDCPLINNTIVLMVEAIHVPRLLAHAHALAKHSSAPISSLLAPIDRAQYMPWPTENAMRQGLLFQMEGSMSGVGQTGQVGDGTSPPPITKASLTNAEGEEEDVIMAEQVPAQVHREEVGRKYDPDAVFTLDLNSDSDDE